MRWNTGEVCAGTYGSADDLAEGVQNVVVNVARNVVTNEDRVLAVLQQDGKLMSKVLALSLGLTQRQVQRILANLKEEKKIIRHGASKNGYWEVTD